MAVGLSRSYLLQLALEKLASVALGGSSCRHKHLPTKLVSAVVVNPSRFQNRGMLVSVVLICFSCQCQHQRKQGSEAAAGTFRERRCPGSLAFEVLAHSSFRSQHKTRRVFVEPPHFSFRQLNSACQSLQVLVCMAPQRRGVRNLPEWQGEARFSALQILVVPGCWVLRCHVAQRSQAWQAVLHHDQKQYHPVLAYMVL